MAPVIIFPLLSVFLPVIYFLGKAVYNVYFHPLSRFPGPKYLAATRMSWAWHTYHGTLNKEIVKAHSKYGEVIRVAPDELSFISGDSAWQDIYGFHSAKSGKGVYFKDRNSYLKPINGAPGIVSVHSQADHSRHRRLLSHAFSDKALREQEPMLHHYINLMLTRLHDSCQGEAKGKTDMVKWYNFTTVDIIGDFAFGEPFNCLERDEYHFFVKGIFTSVMATSRNVVDHRYPLFAKIRKLLGYTMPLAARKRFLDYAVATVKKRLALETDRPDLMTYATRHQGQDGVKISRDELDTDAGIIIAAGSETTATQMAGVTYLLCKNPEKMKRLREELHSVFKSIEEIDIESVTHKAPYLIACINEGLRYYPPVPTGFPRVVPEGGDTISGYHVPEATAVYVSQYAANHSTRNFKDPDVFIPERWLEGNTEFASDKKNVHQPFSFGPRNCIGKNLAYAELRLMLAKTMWSFDMALLPETRSNWLDQKTFVLWEKPPLMVQLTPYVKA